MISIVVSLLSLGLAVADAAGKKGPPSILSDFKPVVGSWAEYDLVTKSGNFKPSKAKMRVAVVGKEGSEFWLENSFKEEAGKRDEDMVMKMLVGKDAAKPKRVLAQTEDGVMDMTSFFKPQPVPETKGKLKESGREKLKTPAGLFDAKKLTYTEGADKGEIWVKDGVGPYGLVRQVWTSEGETIEMTVSSYGGGAKSQITGTPKRMGMGGGMDEDDETASDDDLPADARGNIDVQEMMKRALREKNR